MITEFSPSVSNKNKQNFCAIIPKHYTKAQEAVKIKSGYVYPVQDTNNAYGYGDISKQDALDTLDAIKKIYPEKFHKIVDTARKWVEDFTKK